jgi:outer membrane protein assembly factor BamB
MAENEIDSAVPPPPRRRLRWWLLAGILVIGVVLITVARLTAIDNAFRNFNTIFGSLGTLLLLVVWFVFLSGLRWRTRLLGLAALVAVAVAAGMSIEVDGFYGDMVPQFRRRGSAARDFGLESDAAVSHNADAGAARVDLRTTTPHDFPRFLGPFGRGAVEHVRLARDWSKQQPRQLWRQPIGAGWSAFSVVGDYAVTQEQRGELELVTCYEIKTGQIQWTHEDRVRFSEVMGGDGPRATPTIVDGRVYAMGATGILNCLDGGAGKVIWSRDVLADNTQNNLQWGKSCSPLVFDDIVVVTLGDEYEPSLTAYTGDGGRVLWRAGNDKPSYATPVLATLAEREQILVVNQNSVAAHDPSVGDMLWEYSWPGEMPKCANPVPIGDDRVLISTGYGLDCVMLQVKSARGKLSVSEVWKNKRMKTKFTNVVVRDGFVYGLDDGIMQCLDLANGDQKWKGGRYGHGQVLLVGDVLLVTTESGEVVLVEAAPTKHRELARFAALTGKTWNNAALARRYLLVRNAQEAACYELPLADFVGSTSSNASR